MTNKLSKATVLELAGRAIPEDGPAKQLVLETLGELIPADEETELLDQLRDPQVQRVLRRFHRHAEEAGGPKDLSALFKWLSKDLLRATIDYERRMGEIFLLLQTLGEINPDDEVTVPGSTIIDIRFLTVPMPGMEEEGLPQNGEARSF